MFYPDARAYSSIERGGLLTTSLEPIVILDICSFYTRGIWIQTDVVIVL